MQTIADMFRKEGVQEGVILGRQEGGIDNAKEMLIEAAGEKFGVIKPLLANKINTIQSIDTLKALFRQVFRVDTLEEFTELVNRVTEC